MSKLVLELTPLDRGDSELNTLLLGAWCDPSNNRTAMISEYHWDDRSKLFRDYQLVWKLYEKYLLKMTQSLNLKHKVNHSVEFWRVIVGPWLHYFISILLDRYETLSFASKNYDIDYARLASYDRDDWVPLDYVDFNYQFYSDEWNHYLFSEIIKFTGLVKVKETSFKLNPSNIRYPLRKPSKIKSFLFAMTKFLRNKDRKVVFVEVDLPQRFLYKLLYKLKSLSFAYYLRAKPKSFKLNWDMRANFFTPSSDDTGFERLIDKLIPLNIPISYLEGYRSLEEDSKKIFPENVDLIVTSGAYFSNEHFKVWCARKKNDGTKLWVTVHGGHHGTALFNGPGKLTEEIADRFYSWGWGNCNWPSPKLSLLRDLEIKKSDNKILFIPYSVSRYSNHIDSSPLSTSFNGCLELHSRFFNTLDGPVFKDDILIRLKSGRDLWDLDIEYGKFGISNFVYSNEQSLIESFSRSALVIVSYDSTVFLEALTLNIPTCLFIREEYWEMNQMAAEFFNELRACGVLHYDENSLLKHIMEVKDDYDEWWYSDSVQMVVGIFLKKFGLSSICWDDDWFQTLEEGIGQADA